ncbi:MAG: PAS domain S-box protein [Syntrophomonadaceae bacterium]|nr:PAS domain S-box protein [Syntrophomonadaceae bacterium]
MLEEKEPQFLLDCIEEPVAAVSKDMRIVYCNSAYAQLFDRTVQEIEGRELLSIFPENSGNISYQAYLEVLETGRSKIIEVEVKNRRFSERIYPSPEGILSIANDITGIKKYEAVIQAISSDYRIVLNELNDAVFIFDPYTADIVDVNKTACKLFGYFRNEILGLNMEDLCADEAPYTGKEFVRWLKRSPEMKPQFIEWKVKDGSKRQFWVEVKSRRLFFGDEVRFVAAMRDITVRKHLEEKLGEIQERYDELFEGAADFIFAHDLGGNFISANPAAEKITGYSNEELVRMNIQELAAGEYLKMLRGFQYQKIPRGEHVTYELGIMNKYGKRVYLEVVIWPIYKVGKPLMIQGIARDITKRKQEEINLKESEQRLASFINWLPDAALAINMEGEVVVWNKAMEQLTGVKAEEMLGKGDYEYALAFYNSKRPIMVDLVLRPEEVKQYYSIIEVDNYTIISEFGTPRLKGGSHHLWGQAMPWYDSEGNLIGAIETLRDVTSRYKRTQELEKDKQEMDKQIQHLHALLDGVDGIICSCDGDGRIIFAGKRFSEVSGYRPEEIIGQNITDFVADGYKGTLIQITKEPVFIEDRLYEISFSHRNGSQYLVRVGIELLRQDNEVAGVVLKERKN